MADLTITAANVGYSGGTTVTGTAGGTITAGMTVYMDTSDSNKWKAADADALASSGADGLGIALVGCSSGQPIIVLKTGTLTGVGATQGVVYCVSTTAGGIAPVADLLTGDYISIVGVGNASSGIGLSLYASSAVVQ